MVYREFRIASSFGLLNAFTFLMLRPNRGVLGPFKPLHDTAVVPFLGCGIQPCWLSPLLMIAVLKHIIPISVVGERPDEHSPFSLWNYLEQNVTPT